MEIAQNYFVNDFEDYRQAKEWQRVILLRGLSEGRAVRDASLRSEFNRPMRMTYWRVSVRFNEEVEVK